MSFSLCIADIGVTLEFGNASIANQWKEQLIAHNFFVTDNTKVDLYLRIDPVDGWLNPVTPSQMQIESEREGFYRSIRIEWPDFSGLLEQQNQVHKGEFIISCSSINPLLALIKTCLSFVLEDRRQLMVHASGVIRNGQLWLFSGPSGSGKTTVAIDLRAGGTTFSVDMVVVSIRPDGTIQASATPFGDDNPVAARPRSSAVASIIFLEQSMGNSLLPLSPHEGMRMLLEQTMAFEGAQKSRDHVVETLGSVAERVPCYLLKFEKNERFWNLLDTVQTTAA